MSDSAGTSKDVHTQAHSQGQPDPIHHREPSGSDVGGPAQTAESATESALDDTATVSHEDESDDPARNPN